MCAPPRQRRRVGVGGSLGLQQRRSSSHDAGRRSAGAGQLQDRLPGRQRRGRRLPSAGATGTAGHRGPRLSSERRRSDPAPFRSQDGHDRVAPRRRGQPVLGCHPARGGGRRRAARGVRALGQPRRGRRPRAGAVQAVRRPARRRAGARARRGGPVPPRGRAAAGYGDRVRRPGGGQPAGRLGARHQQRRRRGGGAAPRGRGPPAHRLPRRPADHPDRGPAARGLPRRARRPGHRRRPRPGRPGRPGRGRLGRGGHGAAVAPRPADGALHRPEHDHDRRGAGAAPPRPRAPGGAGRLRRLPAGRAALPGRHGGGAGPGGDGPHGRRAAVRPDRRQRPSARGAAGADHPDPPRLRRDIPHPGS